MNNCKAYLKNLTKTLPRKTKKIVKQKRYFNYLFISDGKTILINQRKQDDIWKNLYEFPLIETDKKESMQKLQKRKHWVRIFGKRRMDTVKIFETTQHLTHQQLLIRFIEIRCKPNFLNKQNRFKHTSRKGYKDYPYPVVIYKYLKQIFDSEK